MERPVVTLTTDFGLNSAYPAQMKGVLLSRGPTVCIIDVTHAIPPHDVASAGMALLQVARSFPPGTLHLAVVDPGVGSNRDLLLISCEDNLFLAPDNGLLDALYSYRRVDNSWRVACSTKRHPDVSPVFHGRDIFAPLAAAYLSGTRPEDIGTPCTNHPVDSIWQPHQQLEQLIEGSVLFTDSFGNLFTNIDQRLFEKWLGQGNCVVEIGDHHGIPLVNTYADVESGLLALINSCGLLEIAWRNESAGYRLGSSRGDAVRVRRLE